jgi:hypothetical protein
MKKIIFSFITVLSLNIGFGQEGKLVYGDNIQKREAKNFHSIEVSNGIKLVLTKGGEETVVVDANESHYLDKIKTEVNNGILKIYWEKQKNVSDWKMMKTVKLTVYVSYKNLDNLKANSGASITHQGDFVGSNLDVALSSGASMNCAVKLDKLNVEQSSGATSNFSGNATNLAIKVNSGSQFKGYDLVSNYCNADARSGAGIKLTVNKELTAFASSGGGVNYKGEGLIKNIDIKSGGHVKRAK